MKLLKGESWHCPNPECGAKVEVVSGSAQGGFRLTCCCGAVMKKPYSKPLLITLDKDDLTAAEAPGRQSLDDAANSQQEHLC